MKFNEVYYDRYGIVDGKETPSFIVGFSLGGNIAANISTMGHMNYKGQCLLAPYFAMKDPNAIEKLRPIAQAMAKVTPN